jgi:hypothetical protein
MSDAAVSRTSEPPVVGFGVACAVIPFGKSTKNKSTGRIAPRGKTKTSIVVEEPMLTVARGDGICRSNSNGAEPKTGVVVVVAAAGLAESGGEVIPGVGFALASGAAVTGIGVAATMGLLGSVGVVGAGAKTTLRRLIVVVPAGFATDFKTVATGLLTGHFVVVFVGVFVGGFLVAASAHGVIESVLTNETISERRQSARTDFGLIVGTVTTEVFTATPRQALRGR